MLNFQSQISSTKSISAWSERKYKSQRQQLRSQSMQEKLSENRRRFLNNSEFHFPTCPFKIQYCGNEQAEAPSSKVEISAFKKSDEIVLENASFSFVLPTNILEEEESKEGPEVDQSDSPEFVCDEREKQKEMQRMQPRYAGRSKSLTRNKQTVMKFWNISSAKIEAIEDSMNEEDVFRSHLVNKARVPRAKISSLVKLGEYLYDRNFVLGQGSFGKVFRGFHKCCKGFEVAIKEIEVTPANHKFFEEISITQSIVSDNVVRLYDSYYFPNFSKCYVVLELCNQGSLEDPENNHLPLTLALDYFKQIIKGMRVLCKLNIIHRDLKRANILLKDRIVKISDFGFAKSMGQQLEVNSLRCGTPATMAPEIYFNRADQAIYNKKCDIWSLGVILHQMVYELHPFETQEHFEKVTLVGWGFLIKSKSLYFYSRSKASQLRRFFNIR